jgi:hypothetical protein
MQVLPAIAPLSHHCSTAKGVRQNLACERLKVGMDAARARATLAIKRHLTPVVKSALITPCQSGLSLRSCSRANLASGLQLGMDASAAAVVRASWSRT